jgi:Protein of unknown function (DUF1308)
MPPSEQITADYPEQPKFQDDFSFSSSLHADLLSRARFLLEELTAFQSYLKAQKKEDVVDIRNFRSSVQSEIKSLERISSAIPDARPNREDERGEEEIKKSHVLRSSNLPFYEAVWAAAGKCEGVTALGKRIHREHAEKDDIISSDDRAGGQPGVAARAGVSRQKRDSVTADVVADDGQTWIKVSTITEKRLLFQMAKEGWERCNDDSSQDDADSDTESGPTLGTSHHDSHSLDLIRLAEAMKKAASTTRVRYRHPKVNFILSKISEGRLPEIDAVIEDLKKTGAGVQCMGELQISLIRRNEAVGLGPSSRFSSMLPWSHPPLTPTLNIDCTILLALISDISHLRSENLEPAPNGKYHSAITRQIKAEEKTLLLQSELLPLLVGRQMRCTKHAARRMNEIVQTMGTVAEKTRAEILLGANTYAGLLEHELQKELKHFSDHDIPIGLRLPLVIVEFDGNSRLDDGSKFATRMMWDVGNGLSEINKSVFLYGWTEKIVTISSNMVVAKEIERRVCQLLDEREKEQETDIEPDDATGPNIWVCRTARSLIGKEKGRREG